MIGCGGDGEEGVRRHRMIDYLLHYLLKVLKTNFIHSYVLFYGYGKAYFFLALSSRYYKVSID